MINAFLRTLGWALVFLLVVEAITGTALSAFYAPSATDAWASVAYVQDRATWGWLVRGIHFHAASVIIVISGLHLLQVVLAGTYRKPRHQAWWVGLGLLGIIIAIAITGFVLRWDQAGFWANKVEVGIAGGTPIIGDTVRELALGGNDQGNLTVTRFHMLHVVALPALAAILTVLHVRFARKVGEPRDAAQPLRDLVAMAIAMAAVLTLVVSQHGVDLGPPADPAQAYDARPLWFIRWLFELRHLAGSAEKLAALAAPAVVGGILAALPIVDRSGTPEGRARRWPYVGAATGLFAVIAALTVVSIARDANNDARNKAMAAVDKQAAHARDLASRYGVPATGPLDVYATPPMWRARTIYATRCRDCHDAASDKRKGPIIAPGHGGRAWLEAFLKDPNGATFYGKTKLAKTDNAMKPVELPASEMTDLVEALYAESGAPDVDVAKRDRGRAIFEKACTDCHALGEGVAGTSAPGLGGLGSRDYYTHYIGNPKSAIHMGADSEMPRFDKELTIVERDAMAGYLVWLRSATNSQLDALGPL
ncbi:MAG: cytochrome b N-terminal domain-containing protein [Proteobacteria bacterium]|nr:cytochrome b N-terminal domain-containing protein [Pseudomonadota bacterium]